jgi:TRAP-type transport system periplasmic protein
MSCSWIRAGAAAVFLACLLVLSAPAVHAGPVVIKMATLAPEGSPWYRILQKMGEEWKKASGGSVILRLYPGGVAGDEEAMLRKMRVGQLHAAAITGMGLAFLDRSFYALHIPMFYTSDEEFDYVRDRIAPMLEERLEEKGLIVLTWGDAGWVRFFATRPFLRPEDVKAKKLFVGAGDVTLTQLYKEAGFRPVTLSVVDILPALQTGLIEAFDTTPLAALAFQWFALAPHMADLKWAPLTGATIIDRRVWEKIPEELRPRILEVSRAHGEALRGEIRRLNEEAVEAMVRHGLKVITVPPDAEAQWRAVVEAILPRVRGRIVPAEAFDAVRTYRDAYRAGRGTGKAAAR